MLQVLWNKNQTDWYSFEKYKFSNISTIGVYMIWYAGNPGRTVRIGQGTIGTRLTEHKQNNTILSYRNYGELFVTWAAVPQQSLDGVERYLAENYDPLVGDRFPEAYPIAVNLPE